MTDILEIKQNVEKNKALILLVDDMPKNLQLLGKLLSDEGYKIAALSKGEKVKESAEKLRPDLILLDVMMPNKNGFEVCKELKESPDISGIPVIFLTGKAEKEDVIEGLRLGGADYVTKPFNSEELLARVKTHVELKQSRDKVVQQHEELKKLDATKDKLYSIIGHDLKGPLNAISGLTTLLKTHFEDQQIEGEARKYLDFIELSANKQARLLENLLSWVRYQTGSLQMVPYEFSLNRVIEDAIDLQSASTERKQVEIVFVTETDLHVKGDEQMISTIIRNLLSNALKFSHRGDKIVVSLKESPEAWSLSVTDTGVGMPEEVRDHLFNPDKRPRVVGTDNESGTGLGLILCKEMVEMHNGRIEVESFEGEGSVFTIVVPLEVMAEVV